MEKKRKSGGAPYKFGIYKYNEKPKEESAGVMCDDTYAWYTKFHAIEEPLDDIPGYRR